MTEQSVVLQNLSYENWLVDVAALNQKMSDNGSKSKKVVYIAGPYRDPRGEYFVKQNIYAAEDAAILVWGMGGVALTPHLNTAFFGGVLPDNVWLEGDLILLSRCDAVYMVHGWEQSQGARAEKQYAESLGLPVFSDPETLRDYLGG